MKKFLISLMLVAVMAVSIIGMTACGGSSDKFTGYDIELSRKVVEYLNNTYKSNIKLEFIEINWDQKEALLENGSIDLVWNGMTINESRLEGMSMSIPYLSNKQAILIKKANKSKYNLTSLEAFKASASNAVVGVENGSAAEEIMIVDGVKTFGKEVLPLESQFDILTNMSTGSVEIGVLDSIMAGYYLKNSSYKDTLEIVEFFLSEEEYGIGAKKGNDALTSKINEGIIALAKNGELKKIGDQFGLTSENLVDSNTKNPLSNATDESWNKVVKSGKLIIGYTVFAPIAYTETK